MEEEKKMENRREKRKKQLFFLFALGLILGIILKTGAHKTTVVGFDDYKLRGLQSDFALEEEAKNVSEGNADKEEVEPEEETLGEKEGE